MANALPKISLNQSRDISFDKLVLSQSNVCPQIDEHGDETGLFEIPAGGRRYLAIASLVKRKRADKNVPVLCAVKAADDGVLAEEDSLAENTFREPLHPLAEFRAMQRLSDKGEPDWDKHKRAAPFKRNDFVLETMPNGLLVFPGTGIQDNIRDKAKALGIKVWGFRHLGGA